jgi:hypothetical protein
MPRKKGHSRQKNVEQEGRILLAVQAYKKGEFRSQREAIKAFNVPRGTFQDRLKGREFR